MSAKKRKQRKKALMIILPIIAIIAIIALIIGINVGNTKRQASTLKNDLELVLENIQNKDPDGAEKALELVRKDTDTLNNTLNNGFWGTVSGIERVKNEIDTGKELIGIMSNAEEKIMTPLIALMKQEPLSNLKVGEGGFNVKLINKYLDFVEKIQPDLENMMTEIQNVDTESMVGGMVGNYKEKLYSLTDAYNQASSLLPMLRTILGSGEDRLYLLAAQNSAEIRASGGFPGSIGTITIKDGVLNISNFVSVYYAMAGSISKASQVTEREVDLFNAWVFAPRDACFIPAFDRTAKIWAVGFEDMQREWGYHDREGYWEEQYSDPDFETYVTRPAYSSYMDIPNDPGEIDRGQDSANEQNGNEPNQPQAEEDPNAQQPEGDEEGHPENGGNPDGQEGQQDEENPGGDNGEGNNNNNDNGSGDTGEDLSSAGTSVFLKTAPPQNGIPVISFKDNISLQENGAVDLMDDEWETEFDWEYDDPSMHEVLYVDGIVSLTPAIIQMLLKYTGEIVLSDGTVLNGDNATRVLQYELYHRYFDERTMDDESNGKADALFAETAKTVMKEFVSSFEISKFADFYELFKSGIDKNIIQIWMADEEEEKVIAEAGCSGKLNFEPEKPEAGIFFSLSDPSKLGWYLDIDTELSDPVTNSDGSQTYHMKVTLRNTISDEDITNSAWYITGSYNGTITGFLHCFAPAGGKIENAETDGWLEMIPANYQDLELYYTQNISIDPGDFFEVSFDVTTAPHVDTPLKIRTTPTLSEYR